MSLALYNEAKPLLLQRSEGKNGPILHITTCREGGKERGMGRFVGYAAQMVPLSLFASPSPQCPAVPSKLHTLAMQNVEAVGRMQKSNFPAIAAKVHATNFAHVEWSGYRVDHEAWHDA